MDKIRQVRKLIIHIGASCSGSTSLQYLLTREKRNRQNSNWEYLGRYVEKIGSGHKYIWTESSQHMINGINSLYTNNATECKNEEDLAIARLKNTAKKIQNIDNIVVSDENIGEGLIMRGSYIGKAKNTICETIKYYSRLMGTEKVVVVQITRKDIIKWLQSLYIKTVGSVEKSLSFNDFARIYIESTQIPLKLVNKNHMKRLIEQSGWEYKHFYLEEMNNERKLQELHKVFEIRSMKDHEFPILNSSKGNKSVGLGAQYVTSTLVKRYQNEYDRIKDQEEIYNSGIPHHQIINDKMIKEISEIISNGREELFERLGNKMLHLDNNYELEITKQVNMP